MSDPGPTETPNDEPSTAPPIALVIGGMLAVILVGLVVMLIIGAGPLDPGPTEPGTIFSPRF